MIFLGCNINLGVFEINLGVFKITCVIIYRSMKHASSTPQAGADWLQFVVMDSDWPMIFGGKLKAIAPRGANQCRRFNAFN